MTTEALTSTHEALRDAAEAVEEAQAEIDNPSVATEAIAEAAVEIAAIEGDTQIALAEIQAESAEQIAETFAQENERVERGDYEWQREQAETRERLARLENSINQLVLKMETKTEPSLSIQPPSGDMVVETVKEAEAPIVEPIIAAEDEGAEDLEKTAAPEAEVIQVRKKRGRWLR